MKLSEERLQEIRDFNNKSPGRIATATSVAHVKELLDHMTALEHEIFELKSKVMLGWVVEAGQKSLLNHCEDQYNQIKSLKEERKNSLDCIAALHHEGRMILDDRDRIRQKLAQAIKTLEFYADIMRFPNDTAAMQLDCSWDKEKQAVRFGHQARTCLSDIGKVL